MSGIEEVAKSWLLDPAWQKVFKHTVDVLEDYISYLLVRFYYKFDFVDQNTFVSRLLLVPFVYLLDY